VVEDVEAVEESGLREDEGVGSELEDGGEWVA